MGEAVVCPPRRHAQGPRRGSTRPPNLPQNPKRQIRRKATWAEILRQLQAQFATFGPNLLAGLAVLVLGWLVASCISSLARTLLGIKRPWTTARPLAGRLTPRRRCLWRPG
ncbi:MAG: hypothetical protein KIT22_01595 [Verrucomicrobiae bacterium]|nr:hypothetical protein [Verrucomicrobiae bacterium]